MINRLLFTNTEISDTWAKHRLLSYVRFMLSSVSLFLF